MSLRYSKYLTIFLPLFVVLYIGCTKSENNNLVNNYMSRPTGKQYTLQAAMAIYGYQPERALLILDSAVITGNLSEVRADINRARIYSSTLMMAQLDSLLHGPKGVSLDTAKAICERLLNHDSIKADIKMRCGVMEILAHTARAQDDTIGWMQRSRELIDMCHQMGPDGEVDALRTEAELGAALCAMGQQEQGMAKLDSVISLLDTSHLRRDKKMTFSELDALIIALKRKIVTFGSLNQYAETLPLARRIIELLDEYEQDPDSYHDGSHREPKSAAKRDEYIRFYRSQAQNFITAAYSSLGEHRNMLDAFNKIESSVHNATAREHIARYDALQMQMEAEHQHAIIAKANLVVAAIAILALLILVFAIVVSVKNRAINRKNHLLAMRISDAIEYKKLYWEEKRAKVPAAAPDIETATDEQLFHYINEVIVRERLYLDPRFERQTIMDRFQLTKERVGAIFSKCSGHAKLTSYIQQLRLEYAAKLLVGQPDKSVVQIATDSGFSSSAYFSDRFRQHFGLSPTDFRREALLQRDSKTAS